MAGGTNLFVVDGATWDGLLTALSEAVMRGDSRALVDRLGQLDVDGGALQDLAALPVRACSALDEETVLSVDRCTAGRGCPVEEECPLVRGRPAEMGRSALARALVAAIEAASGEGSRVSVGSIAALRERVERLIEASGLVDAESPPRARTSLAVMDMTIRRGGVAGATGAFLRAGEFEQVAAFVPPGSGRGDAGLASIEAWLRESVCRESALVELAAG